jgi:hypothetical protein
MSDRARKIFAPMIFIVGIIALLGMGGLGQ